MEHESGRKLKTEFLTYEGDSLEDCHLKVLKDMDNLMKTYNLNDMSSGRIITRGKFTLKEVFFEFLFPIFLLITGFLLIDLFIQTAWFKKILVIFLSIFFLVFRIEFLTIFGVKLYQKFAPESLRLSCRFEPSCSEYMILSIKKLGFCKGAIKGVKRLFKCHYPNGGVDYP